MNSPSLPQDFIGVGMTDKYMPSAERPLWNAWYWANKASDCLLVQDTLDTHGHSQWRGNERMAIEHLEFAANALGYDMVKRMTAQQAHDFALARGRAEDGATDLNMGR